MDLVEKYLGKGGTRIPHGNVPSLDSLKYKPSTKKMTSKQLVDDLIDMAKNYAKKGMQQDITANVAWAIKKNDKKKVKMLMDKYGEHLHGYHYEVMQWLDGKLK